MLLAVLTFLVLFLLLMVVGAAVFSRGTMETQLATAIPKSTQTMWNRLRARPRASIEAFVQPFQKVLPKSSAEVSIIQQRLMRAGYRGEACVNIFYGIKVLVPLALVTLVTITGLYRLNAFTMYVLAVGLGFLLPDFVLGRLISARQMNISLGVCDFLDLMVVCIEAGLSLDLATMRTTQELSRIHPPLADELALVSLEQHAGLPRADAWTHMAERTGLPEIRTLVSMLIQVDQFGTSIAKVLRTYSDTLRTQRRQNVEEQAAKTSVKLVFPLVLFIFPSVFVVTLGPAFILMGDAFTTVFGQ
jgi:tight adherence protein C